MRRTHLRVALSLVAFLLVCTSARSQVTTGQPPFGSFSGGPDIVNNANLNVAVNVPVVSKTGRGLPFSYALAYNSSIWYPSGNVWTPVANWGWGNATQQGGSGYVSYKWTQGSCRTGPHNPLQYYDQYSNWAY